jgi:hypothetical protein
MEEFLSTGLTDFCTSVFEIARSCGLVEMNYIWRAGLWVAAVFRGVLSGRFVSALLVAGLMRACKCPKSQLSNIGIATDMQHG